MTSSRTYNLNFLYNQDPNVGVEKSKRLLWFKPSSQNSILNDNFGDYGANWTLDNLDALRVPSCNDPPNRPRYLAATRLCVTSGAQWDHRAAMADRKAAATTESKVNMKDEGTRTAKDKDDIMAAANNQHKSPKKRRKVNH
ncbi:unnamed protein product, partial [Clonostachys chloroleuca]